MPQFQTAGDYVTGAQLKKELAGFASAGSYATTVLRELIGDHAAA